MITGSDRLPEDPAARVRYLDSVFGSIAPKYDLTTKLLSLGQDRRWKAKALRVLPPLRPESRVLDLGTGSAALLLLLRKSVAGSIVGLDRSGSMLAVARSKSAQLDGLALVRGDFLSLPFPDRSFEAITLGYALRYAIDTHRVLREVYRVLKPGGVVVCLDFGVPRNRLCRLGYVGYLLAFGTLWGVILHGRCDSYRHVVESLGSHPGQRTIARQMAEVGLTRVTLTEELGGISMVATGTRPSRVSIELASETPGHRISSIL
jgi:demethylmenaquinone methyltransferase / 2-methoxy-6-polyprenyl-1,4-benzoquinol methylase